MMKNFSIDTLTVSQKRALIVELRESIKNDKLLSRQNREIVKANKAAARIDKRNDRIAKLQAKLDALMNPVGAKAIKANKKAGVVTVTKLA
jgi:tRNA(Phe) wybutosine-synthesizing methylase Tyw3